MTPRQVVVSWVSVREAKACAHTRPLRVFQIKLACASEAKARWRRVRAGYRGSNAAPAACVQGDKPFACPKCHKKRFVVKEDLTMHMKSCGNVYVCTCGIRLCSLGALKR